MEREMGKGGDSSIFFDDELNIVNSLTNYEPSTYDDAADGALHGQSSAVQRATAPTRAPLQPPRPLPAVHWPPGPSGSISMQQPLPSDPHASMSGTSPLYGIANVNFQQPMPPAQSPPLTRDQVAGETSIQDSYAQMLLGAQQNMNNPSRSAMDQGSMNYFRQPGANDISFHGPGQSRPFAQGSLASWDSENLAGTYHQGHQQMTPSQSINTRSTTTWQLEPPIPGADVLQRDQTLAVDPQTHNNVWMPQVERQEASQSNVVPSDLFLQPSPGASFGMAGRTMMPQVRVPFAPAPTGLSMPLLRQLQAPQNLDHTAIQMGNSISMEPLLRMGRISQPILARQDPRTFVVAPHAELFGNVGRSNLTVASYKSRSAIETNAQSGASPMSLGQSIPLPAASKSGVAHESDLANFELRVKQRRKYRHENFPSKLYRLIQDTEYQDKQGIVSFNATGTAFGIHDTARFAAELLPRYFRHGRIASFKRQLSMYGFRRLVHGAEEGYFYHDLFRRGRPELCEMLKRVTEFEVVPRGPANAAPNDDAGHDDRLEALGIPTDAQDAAAIGHAGGEDNERLGEVGGGS